MSSNCAVELVPATAVCTTGQITSAIHVHQCLEEAVHTLSERAMAPCRREICHNGDTCVLVSISPTLQEAGGSYMGTCVHLQECTGCLMWFGLMLILP